MVPSSVAGAALFVLMLTPGLLYSLRRERSAPAAPGSALRETLRVVGVSVTALLAAALAATLARAAAPNATVDVGALLRDPGGYAVDQHVRLAWWSVALLGFASAAALAAADPRLARRARSLADRPWPRKILGTSDTDIRGGSSWTRVFGMYDDDGGAPGDVVVGALLEDGSYVQGTLSSHSPEPDETPDRDLVLRAPLVLRTTDGKINPLPGTYTIVSACRVVRLDVQHVAPPAGGPDGGAPPGDG